jgi:hypothetical protein
MPKERTDGLEQFATWMACSCVNVPDNSIAQWYFDLIILNHWLLDICLNPVRYN